MTNQSKSKTKVFQSARYLPLSAVLGGALSGAMVWAPADARAASPWARCSVTNMPAWAAQKRALAIASGYVDRGTDAFRNGNFKRQVYWSNMASEARRKANRISKTAYAQARDCRNRVGARLKRERDRKSAAREAERQRRARASKRYSIGNDPIVRTTKKAYGLGRQVTADYRNARTLWSPNSSRTQKSQSTLHLIQRFNNSRPGLGLSRDLTNRAINGTRDIYGNAMRQFNSGLNSFGNRRPLGVNPRNSPGGQKRYRGAR